MTVEPCDGVDPEGLQGGGADVVEAIIRAGARGITHEPDRDNQDDEKRAADAVPACCGVVHSYATILCGGLFRVLIMTGISCWVCGGRGNDLLHLEILPLFISLWFRFLSHRVHVEASAENEVYLQWLFFCGILVTV